MPLTSVNNPVDELAGNAARIMLALLGSEKVSDSVELRSKLVVRKSTRIIGECI